MARSNKIDADQAGPHQLLSDSNQTEWDGPGSRSHTFAEEDAKAILDVVVGDALDEARRHLLV
jgi:hypothetical protein